MRKRKQLKILRKAIKSIRELKLNKKKFIPVFLLTLIFIQSGCSEGHENNKIELQGNNNLVSGQNIEISYKTKDSFDFVYAELIDKDHNLVEEYSLQKFDKSYNITRVINKPVASYNNYFLRFNFINDIDIVTKNFPINIEPSVIITSLCHTENCNSLSGNVLPSISNMIKIKTFKIPSTRIVYEIKTPYNHHKFEHTFNLPVDYDYLQNLVLEEIPSDIGFYIALINVKAYNDENNIYAETVLPIKVVRPIEVKHFGKYELAETYEPVPVTGCIPGTIGNTVQYSESEAETRQNSVSININKSWSDSFSSNTTESLSEGISIGETNGTIVSSSMSTSETQAESFSDVSTESESNNISFNTQNGEDWSWTLGETNSGTQSQSEGQSTNTGINGSTTVGVSGEGSLPFLAKASGKVEITAGVTQGWGSSSSSSSSETNTSDRGYSSGASSQNGRTFGSVQNDSRSHSLSGSYALSSSTSNSIAESSSITSGKVWNMSESISSGNVVTEGNSESISQTIVNSNSSSTTFSYTGYIPRGRFGIFFRQTSRYVKLSEIITYDLNGHSNHAGFIMMNSWAWAPELSVNESCNEAMISSLPTPECIIPPCGE